MDTAQLPGISNPFQAFLKEASTLDKKTGN
jgi:hypothetical protein